MVFTRWKYGDILPCGGYQLLGDQAAFRGVGCPQWRQHPSDFRKNILLPLLLRPVTFSQQSHENKISWPSTKHKAQTAYRMVHSSNRSAIFLISKLFSA